ncbi:MAG: TPM domain-containing protein, partial [Rhizobiaceae bacterium]
FPAAFIVTASMVAVSLAVAWILHLAWYDLRPTTLAAAQIAAIGCALAVLWLVPAVRIHMVPRRLRYRRAHDNAMRQFLARNVHRTRARTGVLLFVSIAERYATVIADAGIAEHVGQAEWNAIVAGLTEAAATGRHADGFAAAVHAAGGLLAEHFPKGADDTNELDDHVVEL